MTAGERDGIQETGDLLRPVRSRPSGTRAIAWYGVIGVLATVAIIYLVGIFAAPTHPAPASSSLIGQADARGAVAGDDAFRYSGRVVDDRRRAAARAVHRPAATAEPVAPAQPRPVGPAGASPPPMVTAAHDAAASTVLAHTSGDVPDVSDAAAGRIPVRLPTPAPEDAGVSRAERVRAEDSEVSAKRGIHVVYGAARSGPASATAPDVPPIDRAALGEFPAASADALAERRPAAGASERVRASLQSETMPGTRRAPLAAFMVPAGTPIAVQLDVAVQSDVPGSVVAHLVRDVVDPLSGDVLIPAGTKAIGQYTGLVAGQSRLSFAWRRLVFPDLSSFALDDVPALDEEGRAGLGGAVDTHTGALIRRSLFSALLAQIASRIGSAADSRNTLVLINAGGGPQRGIPQDILAAADRLNQRDATLAPVVTIEANAIFSLYVDRDLLFDSPYAPLSAQGRSQ